MHRNIFLLLITFSLMSSAVAQEHTLELTLEETIEQARQQSPDAQNARHSFRSAYWNYKYYCANYLPTLKLTSNPYLEYCNNVTNAAGRRVRGFLGIEVLVRNHISVFSGDSMRTYVPEDVPEEWRR